MSARRMITGIALAVLSVSFLDFNLVFRGTGNATYAEQSGPPEIKKLFKEKDYQKVIEYLMPRLAELKRDDLLILGNAQSHLKNSIAAMKVYSTGLSQNPKDLEFKSLYGYEQFKIGKDRDSIQTLKEALEINSKFLPAYRYLIEVYEKKKNKYELRLLYQDMLEKFGESIEFIEKLCELSTSSGLYDLSLKYCRRGIEISSQQAANYVFLGITYKETGRTEEAEAMLAKAAGSFPLSDFAQLSFAQYLEEKKVFTKSFVYYQRAAAISSSQQALLGVGSTGVEIEKLNDSLLAFEKACKLYKNSTASFRRAIIRLKQTKNMIWVKKFEDALDRCQTR